MAAVLSPDHDGSASLFPDGQQRCSGNSTYALFNYRSHTSVALKSFLERVPTPFNHVPLGLTEIRDIDNVGRTMNILTLSESLY